MLPRTPLAGLLLLAGPARGRSNASDPYSPYDRQGLVGARFCDPAGARRVSSELARLECTALDEDLPRPGTCGDCFFVCPLRHGARAVEAAAGSALLSRDAGMVFRASGGSARRFVGSARLFEDPASDFYGSWRDLADIEARLSQVAAAAPGGEVTMEDLLPATHEGRRIRALRLRGRGWLPGQARVVFTFGIHAREWISPMTGIYAAEYMVARLLREPDWLSNVEVILVPVANPDGFSHSVSAQRFWRKNRRDNPGTCEGVDLNRNFGVDWGGRSSTSTNPCSDVYIGPSSTSEPESQAIMALLEEAHVHVHLDVHSYGEMILGAWAHSNEEHPLKPQVDEVGLAMQEAIHRVNGRTYRYGTGDFLLYLASGCLQDVAAARGGLGYTVELPPRASGWGSFAPPATLILPTAREHLEGALAAISWVRDSVAASTSTETTPTATQTGTVTDAGGGAYADGPRVADAFYAECSTWYGALLEAQVRCDSVPGCVVLHDYGCDGQGWRYCSSTPSEVLGAAAAGAGACTRVRAGTGVVGPSYSEGPRVSNAAISPHCSSWYGSLGEAVGKCAADSACAALLDYNCDGVGWRYCTSDLQRLMSVGPGTGACTLTPGSPPPPGPTYFEGPRAGNAAFYTHCSGWYGALADAQSRCDADPRCAALHDYSCDGYGWRYCDGGVQAIVSAGPGSEACTMASSREVGPAYVAGPRASNAASGAHCSTWYGSLAEAQALCGLDSGCTALHDYNCDGWGWRYCTGQPQSLASVGSDTLACTLLPASGVAAGAAGT